MPDPSRFVDHPVEPALASDGQPLRFTDDPATAFARWEQGAWVLGAFVHLVGSGALTDERLVPVSADDRAAARVLVAAGLADATGDDFDLTGPVREWAAVTPLRFRREGALSMLGQIASITGTSAVNPRAAKEATGGPPTTMTRSWPRAVRRPSAARCWRRSLCRA